MASLKGLASTQRPSLPLLCSAQVKLRYRATVDRVLKTMKRTTTRTSPPKEKWGEKTKTKTGTYEMVNPKCSISEAMKNPKRYDTLYNIPDLAADLKRIPSLKKGSPEAYEELGFLASKQSDFTQAAKDGKARLAQNGKAATEVHQSPITKRAIPNKENPVQPCDPATAKNRTRHFSFDDATDRKIYICAVFIFVTCGPAAIILTVVIILTYLGYIS